MNLINEAEVNKRKWLGLLISLLSSQWLDLDEDERPPFDEYMEDQAEQTIDLMRYAGHIQENVEWAKAQFDEAIGVWSKQ